MLIKVIILITVFQAKLFSEAALNSLAKRNFIKAINLYSRKNSIFQLSFWLLINSQEKISHSC